MTFAQSFVWVVASIAILAAVSYGAVLRPFLEIRKQRRAPFTERLLRPAGESSRLRLEEYEERFVECYVVTALVSCALPLLALVVTSYLWAAIVLSVGGVGLYTAVRRLRRVIEQRANLRLGFQGERVTAEYLLPLLARGYEVFHDIPAESPDGERFNLDHVIVGPNGVFVVETKMRRKDMTHQGDKRAKVRYDGKELHFPGVRTDQPLRQVLGNCRWLSGALCGRTGTPVAVRGIVSLPGWFVSDATRDPVPAVRNPKNIPDWVMRQRPSGPPLPPDQLRRIIAALREWSAIAI